MLLEIKENKKVVREEVQFNLDGDDELVVHKVQFCDLGQILKGQWLANPHKKLFMTYLLMSPENQKKIKEADDVVMKCTCISQLNSSIAFFISDMCHLFKKTSLSWYRTWFWVQLSLVITLVTTPTTSISPPPPHPCPRLAITQIQLKKKEINLKRAKSGYK